MTNEERAIEIMGHMPANPFGSCFDSSAIEFVFHGAPPGAFLVHGIGVSNMPGEEGMQIAHAWIEFGNMAIDTIWGRVQNKDVYRAGLKVSYSVKYSLDEATELWKKTDYPGPWDPVIMNVCQAKT